MKRRFAAIFFCLLMLPALSAGAAASDRPKGYMALTFDDGPSGPITEALLDGLRSRGVKATFFVCAYRVARYPQALCRTAAEGHEIGLHSCCHDYMHQLPREAVYDDLCENIEAVRECCGVTPRLFRPPGGLYSEALTQAAKDAGQAVILWSVDPRDWDKEASRHSLSAILQHAEDGSVILMHELSMRSVETALAAVDALQAQGYEFCTVSELAHAAGIVPEAGAVYSSFPTQQTELCK